MNDQSATKKHLLAVLELYHAYMTWYRERYPLGTYQPDERFVEARNLRDKLESLCLQAFDQRIKFLEGLLTPFDAL